MGARSGAATIPALALLGAMMFHRPLQILGFDARMLADTRRNHRF